MQAHQLPKRSQRARRVGRGGKRGSYSGRGIKGQKARAGRRIRPQIRDILKKMHKRRGYGKHRGRSGRVFRVQRRALPLRGISRVFSVGEHITTKKLITAGLAKRGELVKILGGVEGKKFTFDSTLAMSKALQKKLEEGHAQ